MGTHHRRAPARRPGARGAGYRARHGLARVRLGFSRAQLRTQRGVYRARARARLGMSQAQSRARHRVAQARHGLGRARHHLSRSSRRDRATSYLRWGVALVGLGVVVGLVASAFVVPMRPTPGFEVPNGLGLAHPSVPPSPTRPPPTTSEPGSDVPYGRTGRGLEAIRYTPTPAPPSPTPSPTPEPTDPAPDPYLFGKYKLEEAYHDVFIGKVVIVNWSAESRDWTVELGFSPDVGELNTFWVDGTPQPTMQRSEDRYVFTSTVAVPGKFWVVLKVHFDRYGRDIDPTVCTVNGADCITFT